MASFRDPARTFEPIEVIERLLEITDYLGHEPVLYLSSSNDLATYLDSFGFDIYSLTAVPMQRLGPLSQRLDFAQRQSVHDSLTAH
jgi:hypothetical protein